MIRRPPRSTLSLHDALPISDGRLVVHAAERDAHELATERAGSLDAVDERARLARKLGHELDDLLRSEEHTSELQSPCNLVCRLLLEKKKTTKLSLRSYSRLR